MNSKQSVLCKKEIPQLTPEEFKEGKAGFIWAPYVTKNLKTSVNGLTVWHSNKLINLWLKIKFFFYKPKELKTLEAYSKKSVNAEYYKIIKIE